MPINRYRILDPLQVEFRAAWADAWAVAPNVEPLNASCAAGGVGQFQFRVRYGMLKHPSESAIAWHDYTALQRQWVRVKRSPYTNSDIIFQGRVESDSRQLHTPGGSGPSGQQVFTAYDGTQQLNKRFVSETIHSQPPGADAPGVRKVIKHLIPFNRHPNGRDQIKNRTAAKVSTGGFDHYIFRAMAYPSDEAPTSEFWLVRDALEYLFAEFMNGSGNPAIDPQWTLTIPTGTLEDIVEPMELPAKASVMELVQILLRRAYGFGWAVLPTVTGYEFRIASLAAIAVTFETATLPANPNTVAIDSADPDVTVHVERSQVENYGKIVVRGAPMVICRSFDRAADELLDGWDTTREALYAAAGGEERANTDWGELWQRYIFEPKVSKWTAEQNPTINPDGTLDLTTLGPIPSLHCSTLEALPLYQGFDYRLDTVPPDFTGNGRDFRLPMVWMESTVPGALTPWQHPWEASIYVLPTTIGFTTVNPIPGRYAAGTAYEGDISEAVQKTGTIVATLAFQSSQRLEVTYTVSGALDSDGVWVIDVPEAELWFLAKDTVTEVDWTLGLMKTTAGAEIRNDREKLFRIIVGVIGRYTQARSRVVVSAKGLHMYHQQMLHILAAVADGTDVNTIAAPITSVQWSFEKDFETTFATGYAI